jgi:hypothetical protein
VPYSSPSPRNWVRCILNILIVSWMMDIVRSTFLDHRRVQIVSNLCNFFASLLTATYTPSEVCGPIEKNCWGASARKPPRDVGEGTPLSLNPSRVTPITKPESATAINYVTPLERGGVQEWSYEVFKRGRSKAIYQ